MSIGAIAIGAISSATVLVFEDENFATLGAGDFDDSATFGDRVVAEFQDGYHYGTAFGPTPNVVSSFGATPGTVPAGWSTGYGDTLNVIWGAGPQSGENTFFIRLTADTGNSVRLHGFDAAGWPGAQPDALLEVRDAGNNLMWSFSGQLNQTTHDSFTWTTPLESSEITIYASQGWWTCVDNVAFSQAVPEPGTFAVLGLGALLLRRRRS
ncbi:MAG: PEP-CTERM sorting domain-containing protein [Fimbriimonadaceae bacterium]|nr:PEP-CTERM sorting domain-containing protein [Fimbriimonadaceae bacterium]